MTPGVDGISNTVRPGLLTAVRWNTCGRDRARIALGSDRPRQEDAGAARWHGATAEAEGSGQIDQGVVEQRPVAIPTLEDAAQGNFVAARFQSSRSSRALRVPSMGEHGYGQPTVRPSGRARRPCRRRVRGGDHGEGAARGNAHVRVRPELHQRRVNTSLPTATPAGHARGLAWKSGRTPAMARDHAAIDREYMTMRSIPLLGERGQHLQVWHVEIEKMMRRTPNVVGLWQCYFFLQIIQ